MKKALGILLIALCATLSLRAQETVVDSTLLGKSIFNIMPSDVRVHQSQAITSLFSSYVAANASRNVIVYRVRVFNDNKQTARNESEAVENNIKNMFPNLTVYRSYQSPFFRVTVGDFRTKSEAMKLAEELKGTYKNCLVIKESAQYPLFNTAGSHDTDMEVKRK
jgi:hypothetical protein